MKAYIDEEKYCELIVLENEKIKLHGLFVIIIKQLLFDMKV
jgi:hypothetical protein